MSWKSNLSRNIMELTVKCCNESAASAATRAFVLNNYHELNTLNPTFPLLIREGDSEKSGLPPRFQVVFHPEVKFTKSGYAMVPPKTLTVDLSGLSEDQILNKLKDLVAEGAKTPQVKSEVPKPIVDSLCEDMHGDHSWLEWPGPALGYDKANMAQRTVEHVFNGSIPEDEIVPSPVQKVA